MTQLSEHFTVEEFTDSQTAARHGIANVPHGQEMENLKRLAATMEKVRSVLGDRAILISSGYRAPRVNSMVGGSKSSVHMKGLAADFTCPTFGAPLAICEELKPLIDELAIDQLIHEYNQWIHLGLSIGKPRHQCLTIDHKGTRSGF